MFIDQTKLHTKTILTIDGPLKDFNSQEGPRQKFKIVFQDGYQAEYCPLVSETVNLPKSGQDFTFKVRYRSPQKGDEIERATVEGQGGVARLGASMLVTMNGHPATIALNAALKHYEVEFGANKALQHPVTLMPSDVMAYADNYLNWLISKQNQ